MRMLFALLFILAALKGSTQDAHIITIVNFEFDKYNLTREARLRIDSFLSVYKKENTNAPVSLKGFCDSVGSLTYNDDLSEKRVAVVHTYLLKNGVPETAFSFMKGYGKRAPVNGNLTPEERRLNRRVEISLAPGNTIDHPDVTTPEKDTVQDFSSATIDSVKQGQLLRLKNINFYGGRHTFLPQALPALNELLEAMKKYPALEIDIQGHICCRIGSGMDGADFDSGDDQLSVNRARAVYYFLANNGISKRRMTYHGFAAQHPLVYPERTEADKTLNRRVEIRIINK
jgi:outer membrane protein OmpA-like peptidoglycan-associated protein